MRRRIASIAMTLIFAFSFQAKALPFAPVASSDLALWLDSTTGVSSTGGTLSWSDLSGHGHTATSAPGQAPAILGSGIGGKQTLLFSGNQYLSIAGQVVTSQQFTIMTLVTDISPSNGFREVFSNWSFTNSLSSVFLGTTGQTTARIRFTDELGGGADSGAPQQGRGSISSPAAPFILGAVSGASNASLHVDAANVYTRSSPFTPLNLTTPYVIGRQGQLNGEYWSGQIASIMVWNRALTSAEYNLQFSLLQSAFLSPPAPENVISPSAFALLGIGLIALFAANHRRTVRVRSAHIALAI